MLYSSTTYNATSVFGIEDLEADGVFNSTEDIDFLPIAFKFMADTAKYYSDKVDKYRIK